jgi:hypothetical protein
VAEFDHFKKYKRKKTIMTLRELIDKATAIGRQVSSDEIPVIYNGVSDSLKSLELSMDNNGNYYIEIH